MKYLSSLVVVSSFAIACADGGAPPSDPTPVFQVASRDYEAIDIGTFGTWTRPRALNNLGQVAGWSGEYDLGAFVWQDGVMQRLESPSNPRATADAINDQSLIAGIAVYQGAWQLALWDSSGVRMGALPARAFHWSVVAMNGVGDVVAWTWEYDTGALLSRPLIWRGGVVQRLGDLSGYQHTEPAAINDRGQVVGHSVFAVAPHPYPQDPEPLSHPFLWANGTMRDLGVFGRASDCRWDNPCARGAATDINSRGDVVGYSEDSASIRRPFLWRDGVMRDLGAFPGRNASARAINNRGQVAGDGDGGAFLWHDGTTQELGSLGGGFAEVTAMNQNGQVVGAALTPAGEEHAVVWSGGGMTDLGLGLPNSEGSRAIAINARGDVLGMMFMTCFRNTVADPCRTEYNRVLRAVLWRRRGPSVASVTP